MNINVSFDNSVANAPGGRNANGAFEQAIDYVVNLYDQLFTNPVTLTIDVGWGEVDGTQILPGALSESESNLFGESYSQLRAALVARDSNDAAILPISDPTGGEELIVGQAEATMLGLPLSNAPSFVGAIGFDSATSFSFTPGVTPAPGSYDFIGAAEHELSEVLGRISGIGFNSFFPTYSPLDLFRFTASGQRQLGSGANSYFSLNNGVSDLINFNNDVTGVGGGDLGDWAPGLGNDSFDAVGSSGVLEPLSAVDLKLMAALGWTQAPVVTVANAAPTVWKNQTETLASVFSASDPQGDPITQYEVYFSAPQSGYPALGTVTLNGTPIAFGQTVTVGSSLSGLVYTGSSTAGSDYLMVRASDGTSWSNWTAQLIATGAPVPVVTVANAAPTVLKNQTETLASVFTARDADPADTITQYEVYFSAPQSGYPALGTVTLNGTPIAFGQTVTVGSSLSGLVYTGSSTAGSDYLMVRASDGTSWSNWTAQLIATGAPVPVVTVANAAPTVLKNQTETLASVFTASDADPADTITQYEVYFSAPQSGYPALGTVTLNGTPIAFGQTVTVGSSLSGLVYTGSSTAGSDYLMVRASDGTSWSNWTAQLIATGAPVPVVTVANAAPTVLKNQTETLASVFTARDADPADTITQYEVYFSAPQSGYPALGTVTLNGTPIAFGQTVTVGSSLSGLVYTGSSTAGSDYLMVRASDGTSWSNWTAQLIATGAPVPVVTVANAAPTVLKNQTETLASVFTARDADPADTITQYEVYFSAPQSGYPALGTVTLNGTPIAFGQTVTVGSSLSGLVYTGSSTAGSDYLMVRASDGTSWSNWTAQLIATGAPVPVVTVANAAPTVLKNQTETLASVFTARDADPADTITQYEVYFSAPQSGYPALGTVTLNGTPIAFGQTVMVGSSLSGLVYTGSSTAGSDYLMVRASDGTSWSNWTAQLIATGAPVPVVTVANAAPTVLKNQTETLASVFTASDADPADTITQYEVYFSAPQSGYPALGTVTLNGTPIAFGQVVTVGSSLSGLVYTGSSTAGSDYLMVRASDGTSWSNWTAQLIATGAPVPVVTVANAAPTVLKNQTETLASVFTARDADPADTITQYEVYFSAPQSGYPALGTVTLNGTPIAFGQTVTVGSSLSGLVYTGSSTAGSDYLMVRASDGTSWSNWTAQLIATGTSPPASLVAATISPTLQLGTQGNDSLTGNTGSDSFAGGAGNDTLIGNGGYDYYGFDRTGGQATIINGVAGNTASTGELDFGANIATDQLWLQQSGSNLQIDVMGTSERVTVAGWYAAANAPLQHIVTADGSKLDGQLSSLVTAMATFSAQNPSFDPTAAASSQAPNDSVLQAALAAAWHH